MQSTTFNSYKNRLLSQLKDKECRNAFVESHITEGISFQIRTMRNNRKLKQEDVGKLAGMKQEAICRLENPNYGSFTLKTLQNIASAFDVALVVRFVPFGELVKWDLNLSADSLDVPSYNEDPYFQVNEANEDIVVGGSTQYKVPEIQEVPESVIFLSEYAEKKSMTHISWATVDIGGSEKIAVKN